MGGRIPYGFGIESTVVDGIKTSKYIPIPEESEHMRIMFSMYADPANSLGDIVNYFSEKGIKHLRGSIWRTGLISSLLRNPVYVEADADVYEFFRSQGANIINPVSDFTGYNSCYLYQGSVSTTRKQLDLADKEVVLAPHQGIVSSQDWIKCRLRCLSNKTSTRTGKAKNSWLVGKVKCGKCGYSLMIAKSNSRAYRYFICSTKGATMGNACKGTGGTIYAGVLEDYVLGEIRKRLAEFNALRGQEVKDTNPKVNENKIRISQIDGEIEDLLSKVISANSVLKQYINEKIESLDTERWRLQEEVLSANHNQGKNNMDAITDHVEQWDDTSYENRQSVVDTLIKVIHIADGNIDITWNI
jgi:hypothetical protein